MTSSIPGRCNVSTQSIQKSSTNNGNPYAKKNHFQNRQYRCQNQQSCWETQSSCRSKAFVMFHVVQQSWAAPKNAETHEISQIKLAQAQHCSSIFQKLPRRNDTLNLAKQSLPQLPLRIHFTVHLSLANALLHCGLDLAVQHICRCIVCAVRQCCLSIHWRHKPAL